MKKCPCQSVDPWNKINRKSLVSRIKSKSVDCFCAIVWKILLLFLVASHCTLARLACLPIKCRVYNGKAKEKKCSFIAIYLLVSNKWFIHYLQLALVFLCLYAGMHHFVSCFLFFFFTLSRVVRYIVHGRFLCLFFLLHKQYVASIFLMVKRDHWTSMPLKLKVACWFVVGLVSLRTFSKCAISLYFRSVVC